MALHGAIAPANSSRATDGAVSPGNRVKHLTQLSEDALIAAFFAPLAGEGGLRLRDDAALLNPPPGRDLVLTKDLLVAGVHFFADDPPSAIARKALRVNLSDLAAKAAEPLGFLLGLALPVGWTAEWLESFAEGLGEDAANLGCPLLGGDTVKTPGPLMISITAIGSVAARKMVRRDGVKTGDYIYATGTIGDAALGLKLRLGATADQDWIGALSEADARFLGGRYLLPQPRLAMRASLAACAHAAMDISDGLAGDLGKMLGLAGMTARIDLGRIPLSGAAHRALQTAPRLIETICAGGDDYELLCAVPPAKAAAFEAGAAGAGIGVSRLAAASPGESAPAFIDSDGGAIHLAKTAFQHF
jgi:thiamine-monophosphate kinase